jgi:hypothetical protein
MMPAGLLLDRNPENWAYPSADDLSSSLAGQLSLVAQETILYIDNLAEETMKGASGRGAELGIPDPEPAFRFLDEVE